MRSPININLFANLGTIFEQMAENNPTECEALKAEIRKLKAELVKKDLLIQELQKSKNNSPKMYDGDDEEEVSCKCLLF